MQWRGRESLFSQPRVFTVACGWLKWEEQPDSQGRSSAFHCCGLGSPTAQQEHAYTHRHTDKPFHIGVHAPCAHARPPSLSPGAADWEWREEQVGIQMGSQGWREGRVRIGRRSLKEEG